MNYLLIVQGEGRGHLTQAIALAELLRHNSHTVVEVLVGKCQGREIPPFFFDRIGAPVVGFDSPSIDYGRSGTQGQMLRSVLANLTPKHLGRWVRSIALIARRIRATEPDVVINLYDMLGGLAHGWSRTKAPLVAIAHQFLVDHPDYPHKKERGVSTLRWGNRLAGWGSSRRLALSFYPLPEARHKKIVVVPPLLRVELFDLAVAHEDFYLGYMLNAAYFDQVDAWHRAHSERVLHFFWDKKEAPETWEVRPGLTMHRLNDKKFLSMMARCKGYVTTAGFESVCEALYLGKPIQMIPAHVEQRLNGCDAVGVGAGVVGASFDLDLLGEAVAHYEADTVGFRAWVGEGERLFLAGVGV